MLGLVSVVGFDEAQGDFDVSDSAGPVDEQHELFGFVVAYSESVTAEQEVVGSGPASEGASAAFTLGCVAAVTLLVVSVGCSVSISAGTSDLIVVVFAFFGPQQPPPQAIVGLWMTKVQYRMNCTVKVNMQTTCSWTCIRGAMATLVYK